MLSVVAIYRFAISLKAPVGCLPQIPRSNATCRHTQRRWLIDKTRPLLRPAKTQNFAHSDINRRRFSNRSSRQYVNKRPSVTPPPQIG